MPSNKILDHASNWVGATGTATESNYGTVACYKPSLLIPHRVKNESRDRHGCAVFPLRGRFYRDTANEGITHLLSHISGKGDLA